MINILTIAGSDPMGGAGIQGDLKTIAANSCYGLSAITAITAQNSQSFSAVYPIASEMIKDQLKAVSEDVDVRGIKIGMLFDRETIKVVDAFISGYKDVPIILDPVIYSSTNGLLLSKKGFEYLMHSLVLKVTLLTPNTKEASIMSGISIQCHGDVLKALRWFEANGIHSVLIKGGHLDGDKVDTLLHSGEVTTFVSAKVQDQNNHGTGCALSSAIVCRLAIGDTMTTAIRTAKVYVRDGIKYGLDIGNSCGPINHFTKGCDTIG